MTNETDRGWLRTMAGKGRERLGSLGGSRYERFPSNRVRVDLDEHIDDLNTRLIELTTRVEELERRIGS